VLRASKEVLATAVLTHLSGTQVGQTNHHAGGLNGHEVRDYVYRGKVSIAQPDYNGGLVDVGDGVGLVAIAGFARELGELLGAPVDVVPADSLKRAIRADVLAEALPL